MINEKILMVKNYSINNFDGITEKLKAEFERKNAELVVLNNAEISMMTDDELIFNKCLYWDKDISLGLRLELAGMRLFNNIGSIELCDDKRRTYQLLKNDFNIPETVVFPLSFQKNDEFLDKFDIKIAKQLGFPMIVKEAFGSLGEQVFLINNMEMLQKMTQKLWNTPHLYQKYVQNSHGRDIRIYAVGGKIIGAMERKNDNDFRSNIFLGGQSRQIEVTDEMENIAKDISDLFGLDFCGIDLLYGENELLVCEVNSNALFTNFDKTCNTNAASEIADYMINY